MEAPEFISDFRTYPEMIAEIAITTSTLGQRGTLVILHLVPHRLNLDGNDQAGKLENESTGLEVVKTC